MKKMDKIAVFLVGMFISSGLLASTDSGPRKILKIGCQKYWGGACFMEVDGPPIGPEGCKGNSVRWEVEKEANGKAVLSLLSAAYFAGKRVDLRVSDSCFKYLNTQPTFDFFNVVD